MDPATSRKIKHVARHVVAARWSVDGAPGNLLGATLGVALESLDLGDSADVVVEGGLERLAARVHVQFGDRALLAFQLHVGLQILVATAARGGAERLVLYQMVESVASAVESLELDGLHPAMESVYEQLREDWAGREIAARIDELDSAVDGALGIRDALRHGVAPDLGVTWAEVYRTARLLGALRADDVLSRDDVRLATELPYALQLIGYRGEVPSGAVSSADAVAVWHRVEATLGIAVGGLAEQVHRAALHLAVCRDLEFPGLALRKALGDLSVAVRSLGNERLADRVRAELSALVGVDLTDEGSDPVQLDVLEGVDEWLDGLLPAVGLDAVVAAQIAVCADRFSGFVRPVTAARIEGFITQFPSDHRWVATGILAAVDYLDRPQISRSVGFLLDGYGMQRLEGAVLGGLDCTHELAFRGPELTLPHRKLESALRDRTVQTVVVADDALLDAAPLIAELEALDSGACKRLREVNLVCAFAIASYHGEATLREYLTERELLFQVLVGRRVARLSEIGWEQEPDVLTEAELAEPLFSPHPPWWRGRDWNAARALCAEIGAALGDERDALGRAGFQDRLVFGHRVPPTTLTLLWKSGAWKGKPWIPLFSAPHP